MYRFFLLVFLYSIVHSGLGAQSHPIPRFDGKLWGYVQPGSEEWAIRPQFSAADTFGRNGLAVVCAEGKDPTLHCGCIDVAGKTVIPFEYGVNFFFWKNESPRFNAANRIIMVKPQNVTAGLYGMLNERGEEVLPFIYDIDYGTHHYWSAHYILYKFEKAQNPDGYIKLGGLVDSLGNVIIPFEHQSIVPAGPGAYIVRKGGRPRLLDAHGQTLIDSVYDELGWMEQSGVYWIRAGKKMGLFAPGGQVLVKPQYDAIISAGSGSLAAFMDQKFQLLNALGRPVDTRWFDSPGERPAIPAMSYSLRSVKLNGRSGIVDEEWREVMPFLFESIEPIATGWYLARLDSRYAIINSERRSATGYIFESLNPYSHIGKKEGRFYLLDSVGKILTPAGLDTLQMIGHIGSHNNEHAPARWYAFYQNGNWGIMNEKGDVIMYPKMDRIRFVYSSVNGEEVFCMQEGKWGVTDLTGNEVHVPFRFDAVEDDFHRYGRLKKGHFLFVERDNDRYKYFLIDWETYKLERLPHEPAF